MESSVKRKSEKQARSTKAKKKSILNMSTNFSSNEEVTESSNYNLDKFSLAPNLMLTKIGPAFIQQDLDDLRSFNSNVNKKPISQINRPDFSLLKRGLRDFASVLIIGDISVAEEFAAELDKIKETYYYDKKIICKKTNKPSAHEIADADFFIFLMELEKCYSITETQSRLIDVQCVMASFCQQSLIVGISSTMGNYANCVLPKDFHNLTVDFQIPSFIFSFVHREEKNHLLKTIYSTITTSCSGVSADSFISWGLSRPSFSKDEYLT